MYTAGLSVRAKGWLLIVCSLMLISGLMLSACSSAPAQEEASVPEKTAESEPVELATYTAPAPTMTPEPLRVVEYTIPAPFFLLDAAFVGEDSGWAVGFLQTDDDSHPLAIFHTRDGGLTWEEQQTGMGDGNLSTVVFTDELTGYAAGQVWGADIPTLILYTRDGGETWTSAVLPPVYGTVRNLFFTDGGTGWSVGADYMDFQSLMMRSEDGITWQAVDHPSHENASLTGIHFPSENVGYAVGSVAGENPVPYLLKTSDGGATWEELPQPMESGWLVDTCFDDENTGWAVGGSGDLGIIARTTDGGATWAVTSLSGSSVGMIGIFSVDLRYNIAVGNLCKNDLCYGLVYCSSDSGETFQEQFRMERNLFGTGSGSIIFGANSFEKGAEPSVFVISDEELDRLKGLEEYPGMILVSP